MDLDHRTSCTHIMDARLGTCVAIYCKRVNANALGTAGGGLDT